MSDESWPWKRLSWCTKKPITQEEIESVASRIFQIDPSDVVNALTTSLHEGEIRTYFHLCSNGWYQVWFVVRKRLVKDDIDLGRLVAQEIQADVFVSLPEEHWACGYILVVQPDGKVFVAAEHENEDINYETMKPWHGSWQPEWKGTW